MSTIHWTIIYNTVVNVITLGPLLSSMVISHPSMLISTKWQGRKFRNWSTTRRKVDDGLLMEALMVVQPCLLPKAPRFAIICPKLYMWRRYLKLNDQTTLVLLLDCPPPPLLLLLLFHLPMSLLPWQPQRRFLWCCLLRNERSGGLFSSMSSFPYIVMVLLIVPYHLPCLLVALTTSFLKTHWWLWSMTWLHFR